MTAPLPSSAPAVCSPLPATSSVGLSEPLGGVGVRAPKFRFIVEGRIASINEYKNNVLRVAVTAARAIQGRNEPHAVIDWAPCISFDPLLNKRLMSELSIGQKVTFKGLIVPRWLDKGAAKKIHMLTLEIVSFEAVPRPTPSADAIASP
jgi:hypothetical protein